MGRVDAAFKEYMQDKERFADLASGTFFDGRLRIPAENVKRLSTDLTQTLEKDMRTVTVNRIRDVLFEVREVAELGYFAIFGIEGETDENPIMPARVMAYDALLYVSLAEEWARRHRDWYKKRDASFNSYYQNLSDKEKCIIPPVRTLVVYLGTEQWTTFRSLHEMMHLSEQQLIGVEDYRIKVLEPGNTEEPFHNPDNIALMELFNLAKRRSGLEDASILLFDKLRELGRNSPSVKLFQAATGRTYAEVWKAKKEEPMYNVFDAALDEARAEGEARGEARGIAVGEARGEARGIAVGEARGIIRLLRAADTPVSAIRKQLVQLMSVSEETAQKYIDNYDAQNGN